MAYRQLPGQASEPVDHSDRVTPVPEHVKGTVFPYRGMETHGVEPVKGVDYDTEKYQIDPNDLGEEHPDYMPEEKWPEPIPVFIVNEAASERQDIRVNRYLVQDAAQRIAPQMDSPRIVRIANLDSANTVYISSDSNIASVSGYPIKPNTESNPIRVESDVWAVCASGLTAEVAVLTEYSVKL